MLILKPDPTSDPKCIVYSAMQFEYKPERGSDGIHCICQCEAGATGTAGTIV